MGYVVSSETARAMTPRAVVTPAAAQSGSFSTEAVELCRGFDEAGELDSLGLTFGECVNIIAGRADENQNCQIAGVCGAERVQEQFGTTNKGECVKVLNELIRNQES
jgi:hypothetical protein